MNINEKNVRGTAVNRLAGRGRRLMRLTTLAALALALAASGCAGPSPEAAKPPRPQDYQFVSQGRSFGPPGG